jgi:hypothetical protein
MGWENKHGKPHVTPESWVTCRGCRCTLSISHSRHLGLWQVSRQSSRRGQPPPRSFTGHRAKHPSLACSHSFTTVVAPGSLPGDDHPIARLQAAATTPFACPQAPVTTWEAGWQAVDSLKTVAYTPSRRPLGVTGFAVIALLIVAPFCRDKTACRPMRALGLLVVMPRGCAVGAA